MNARNLVSAIALIASISSANASDLYNPGGSLKDVTIAGMNLSGVYISLGAGGVFSDANSSGTHDNGNYTTVFGPGDVALSGFLGDIRVGYDRSLGSGWLLGIYGDLSYEQAKGTVNTVSQVDITGATGTAHFGYGAGLKLGAGLGQTTVVYGLLGYQGQHVSDSGAALSASTDLNGILVGGGIETELTKSLFFGVEADYVAFESWKPLTGLSIDMDEVRATARIGTRF
jgi:hypothetical protein